MAKKDAASKVAYQQAALVRQLLAERANAVAYGSDTRVEAVDKQLASLGVKAEETKPSAGKDEEPQGRKAPTRRTTAAGKE